VDSFLRYEITTWVPIIITITVVPKSETNNNNDDNNNDGSVSRVACSMHS